MAPSRNRYELLGDAPSSSREQQSQALVTNTADTAVHDADQARPSARRQDLSMLTKAEKLAIVKRRMAEIEQEDKEEEERKKSREASSAILVDRSIPSAASLQVRPKKVTDFDEAKEPLKRRHVGPFPPSHASGEPAPTTVSDVNAESPDVATPGTPCPPAVAPPKTPNWVPRAPVWADARSQKEPLLCIVQANDASLVGSFVKDTKEWAFELTLDVGQRQIPTMTMKCFSNGTEGPQCGETQWRLGDYVVNDWIVPVFKISHVWNYLEDESIAHPLVLAACETSGLSKDRLYCIILES